MFREEEISVSCIGRSPGVLREFFSECRAEYLNLLKNKTSVFEHRDGDWKKTRAIDIRPLDTVILDEKKKTALLEDIKAFLDPQTRAWYSRRGIPYRKGYLLYGPPGTGKSSLSLSIAGACDLDIYILNISSVDDSSLGELFTELPTHCVILLEDIDAVDTTQSRQRGTVKTGQDETSSSTKGKSQGRVSLSALLNVLDGVGSQEGRVLIMTTNHAERLDAALIRPGRVDMKLELGYTNQDINARLFCALFMRDDTLPDGSRRGDEDTLRKLMTEFANKMPEQEFSPAEIQSFLLEYTRSPHMAVENVQEWVVRTREGKRQIKRADSWVLQEGGDILG
jgi:chaperone BCS1